MSAMLSLSKHEPNAIPGLPIDEASVRGDLSAE